MPEPSMTRQYCRLGSRTIAYLDSAPGGGALRTYVLLHAFPLGANHWEPQMRSIPTGWRLITPDLRGFGGSTELDPPNAPSISITETVPGATFVSIPAAGHLSNLEQPALFNAALNGFLATL